MFDSAPLPSSKTFLLGPGEMVGVEVMLGLAREITVDAAETVDITKLSPNNVDFHIGVE